MAKLATSITIRADSSKLPADLRKAEGSFSGFGNKLRSIARIGPAAAAAAIVAVGAAAVAAGKQAVDFGDNLAKAARAAGTSVESFQAIDRAVQRVGGSSRDTEKLFQNLQRSIAGLQGSQQRNILEGLGLDPESLREANPEEAFETVVRAIGQVENATDRSAAASALFGRQYREVLQLAANDASALTSELELFNRVGVRVSQQQAEAAESINDAYDDVLATIRTGFASGFLPEESINRSNDFVEVLRYLGATARFVGQIIRHAFSQIVRVIGILSRAFGVVKRAITDLLNFVVQSTIFQWITRQIERIVNVMRRAAAFFGRTVGAGISAADDLLEPVLGVDSPVSNTLDDIRDLLREIWHGDDQGAEPAFQPIEVPELATGRGSLREAVENVGDAADNTANSLENLEQNLTPIQETLQGFGDGLRQNLSNALRSALRGDFSLLDFAEGVLDSITNSLVDHVSRTIFDPFVENIVISLTDSLSGAGGGGFLGGLFGGGGLGGIFSSLLGGLFGGIFHDGGTVPGPVGQERLILAQSGETVLPIGARDAEPVSVTINQNITGDIGDAYLRALNVNAEQTSNVVLDNFRQRGIL